MQRLDSVRERERERETFTATAIVTVYKATLAFKLKPVEFKSF